MRSKSLSANRTEIEKPSDISGLIYIPFKNHVDEAKMMLSGCLQDAGFSIDIKGLI